jgi:deoxyribodipyrimidine photo-lyase
MALTMAAKEGTVLPLYILEPDLWKQPDLSYRHYQFLQHSLFELDKSLRQLGQPLVIKVGDAVEVFTQLKKRHDIQALWSHQETWNAWTYERDKTVKQWSKKHNIPWYEPSQNGVIRCLQDRDGWASRWYKQMHQPVTKSPEILKVVDEVSEVLPSAEQLELHNDGCTMPQKGGRHEGLKLLHSFLNERGEGYSKEISSPVSAYESCSRLSAHLAFGTLSIREVFQASEMRKQEIKKLSPGSKGKWPGSLRSFSGRLRWHCHFIQKLEDEPGIEFNNMHPAYDGLREHDFNNDYFQAWKSGKTGYPMIDACMRALTTTGWLNFRMRAMLMSFASYHLWLHWREPALHLASLFTDYEPGIHYSQVQMQSGTTGINSIRIYNPIKQGLDHDPDGIFIRKWVHELVDMPQEYIHTPWKAPAQLNGYPLPIVEEKTARKAAAEKLYGLRKAADHKEISRQIVAKHGSRKSGLGRSLKQIKKQNKYIQQELPL